MGAISSQITSITVVYSTVYSDAGQRKHQSSASLAFVRGIHRRPVNTPHKCPVTRKMFPFDDVFMVSDNGYSFGWWKEKLLGYTGRNTRRYVGKAENWNCLYGSSKQSTKSFKALRDNFSDGGWIFTGSFTHIKTLFTHVWMKYTHTYKTRVRLACWF